jgi:hypothetical protein
MRSAPVDAKSPFVFVRAGPSRGLHTWYFVPGSDARREIPSTATERDGEAITGTNARRRMRRTATPRVMRRPDGGSDLSSVERRGPRRESSGGKHLVDKFADRCRTDPGPINSLR